MISTIVLLFFTPFASAGFWLTLLALLGLNSSDLEVDGLEAQAISTGARHLLVPVRSLSALGRVRVDAQSLIALAGAGLLASCQNSAVENSNTQTNATNKTDLPKITHRKVQTNGINMHIGEAGAGFPVLFLHGFAEL